MVSEHEPKHHNESKERKDMENHDASLDERQTAEEYRVGQDDEQQDAEGDQSDLPVRRCEVRIA